MTWRSWVGLGVLAVVGIGAFGLFQLTTSRALERAEALRFRRMQVTRLAEPGVYRFFHATNRVPAQPESPLLERFSNERGTALAFGAFDTAIEPTLGIGMLVNPSDWFENEEIRLLRVQDLTEGGFLDALRDQVDRSPGRSLLVSVQGFRERFPSALRKTAFLAHVLDVDAPSLVFDWPGDQGSTPRGYRRAQNVAAESGQELAGLLALLIRELRPGRLWLLANSMGGDVVVSAFGHLTAEAEFSDAEPEFEDVILTAPDVSHARFQNEFKSDLVALARNVTVYVSSNDRALLMSRILNRDRRLGESTFDPDRPDPSASAAAAFELVDPGSERVSLIDVTPVNRTRNFHNFSLETPEFFDDLYLRLQQRSMPTTRLKHTVVTEDGRRYWILSRDL